MSFETMEQRLGLRAGLGPADQQSLRSNQLGMGTEVAASVDAVVSVADPRAKVKE